MPEEGIEEAASCLRFKASFDDLDASQAVEFVIDDKEAVKVRRFRIENCRKATAPLILERADLEGDGVFTVTSDKDFPIELKPREEALFEVRFSPQQPGNYGARWEVASDAGAKQLQFHGEYRQCPHFDLQVSAVGSADEPGRMALLTNQARRARVDVIDLEEESAIVEWRWSVTGEADLLVSDDGKTAHVNPPGHGYYSAIVEGITAEGWACRPSPNWAVGIHNGVGADVMVVLDWDPDETFDFMEVINFDLHYRHYNGRWRDSQWDVYSRNTALDWGAGGEAYMGQYVLRFGRWESTYHEAPKSGDEIEIGTHLIRGLEYDNDRVIDVRVQVTIRGHRVLELRRQVDQYTRGWHVGTIRWPDQTVDVVDTLHPALWDAD